MGAVCVLCAKSVQDLRLEHARRVMAAERGMGALIAWNALCLFAMPIWLHMDVLISTRHVVLAVREMGVICLGEECW